MSSRKGTVIWVCTVVILVVLTLSGIGIGASTAADSAEFQVVDAAREGDDVIDTRDVEAGPNEIKIIESIEPFAAGNSRFQRYQRVDSNTHRPGILPVRCQTPDEDDEEDEEEDNEEDEDEDEEEDNEEDEDEGGTRKRMMKRKRRTRMRTRKRTMRREEDEDEEEG